LIAVLDGHPMSEGLRENVVVTRAMSHARQETYVSLEELVLAGDRAARRRLSLILRVIVLVVLCAA
jgi:hypothetical protein